MSLLLRYDVILKILILLGELGVISYLIVHYKQYSYIIKFKMIVIVFGMLVYMGSSLLNLFQEIFIVFDSKKVESIELTLEVVGIILLVIGLYIIMLELIKVTNIDFLTKTYTKRYMDNLFKDMKTLSDKNKDVFSLIFIDIDNFKQINDRFGHETGNEVLTRIAKTLKQTVRERDKVGRYGGDEFLIILHSTTHEEAEQILERCRLAISIQQGFKQYQIGLSGGISTYPYDGDNIHTLSIIADMRMYEDKESHKQEIEMAT